MSTRNISRSSDSKAQNLYKLKSQWQDFTKNVWLRPKLRTVTVPTARPLIWYVLISISM